MNKELKRLFVILGLYSLASGIFYIFQELWMAENGLSVQTISTVFSLCSLLSVSVIFLCSQFITKDKLKKFSCSLFLLKVIVMLLLFILNQTGLNGLIKFLIMLDYVIDVELWISLYPLITLIKKEDKIYAIRDLIYDAFYYIGIFLTGLFLGKSIGNFEIGYNFYILLASILTFITFIILYKTNLEPYAKKDRKKEIHKSWKSLNIKKDKISQMYLGYVFFGEISFSCMTELQVLLLADYFEFSASTISNYSILLGIGSVIVGSLVIAKFTLKNNYINLSLKFGIRLFFYLLAFFLNQKILILLAFIFVELSSDAYIDITDAPYVNRYSDEDQLAFNNLKEMIEYVATSIGVFLCGWALLYGIRYIFLVSSVFILFQILLAFYALYLRKQESR